MTEQQPHEPSIDEVSFASGPAPVPPGEGRGRRAGKAAGWIAVGAVGATVLTGVAFAAGSDSGGSTSPSAASPSAPADKQSANGEDSDRRFGHGPGMGGRGPGGFGIGMGRGSNVLHGELVVKSDTDGKVRTVLTQTGDVTAASSTSLTVKSSDGFVATWAIGSDTKIHTFASKGTDAKASDVKVGATVSVSGTKKTDTSGDASFVNVRPTDAQLKELQKNRPQRGDMPDMPGMPGMGAPGQAKPTASATASSSAT